LLALLFNPDIDWFLAGLFARLTDIGCPSMIVQHSLRFFGKGLTSDQFHFIETPCAVMSVVSKLP
jgi:hypothetical protein